MKLNSYKVGFNTILQVAVSAIALALLLASCGGGSNPGDTYSAAPPPAVTPVAGPDSFLLYPNPQSSPIIDSQAYAQAYYTAIDPNNTKDTFAKWKTENGFGSSRPASEVQAVFGDVRDLGYGRYVTARRNNDDGTIAIYVDNYLVWNAAGYAYSSMNLDAAVARDQRWYIGTNAIEVSPGPACKTTPLPNSDPKCHYFAKYYTFEPGTGARALAANLDGRGVKAMPGICVGCHGGRGDALTPPDANGNQLFPVVGNPAKHIRGDVQGKLHFFEPDTFSYSTLPGYTRANQEAALKQINKIVLCSYPLPFAASGVPIAFAEDACRDVAAFDDWQGGAADIIKAAYNGGTPPVAPSSGVIDGMPDPVYVDTYVPPTWQAAGQSTLYQNVVQPTCRMCHILRGTAQQADTDFSTFTSFQTFADRIKDHVVDRGNMPLVKILYSRYWATPSMYNTMNTFLAHPASGVSYTVLDSTGAPLKPGRPVAYAGPSRVVAPSSAGQPAATLSADNSLYSDTYSWSIVSSPAGGDATLSTPSSIRTDFNATVSGTYVVKLVSSKGSVLSDPVSFDIVVQSTWPTTVSPLGASYPLPNPLPSAIRFADIKKVLQQIAPIGSQTCITCHSVTSGLQQVPPIMYSDLNRSTDGLPTSTVSATDDYWFYTEVKGRINFAEVEASPLLRHPSGYHHFGGIRQGFGVAASGVHADDPQLAPGDIRRSYYDMFLNWVLNGAPY